MLFLQAVILSSNSSWYAECMIETDRLILSRPSLDDFEDVVAMGRHEGVARYIGGEPTTREEAWKKLLQKIGHWSAFGFGIFTVRTRDKNTFVGEVGLAYFSRGLGAAFDPFPEAAWVLAAHAHGKGFATEAIVCAHNWMVGHHAMTRSVCIIHPENVVSLRVASKLGYVQFSEADYHGARPLMLERSVA